MIRLPLILLLIFLTQFSTAQNVENTSPSLLIYFKSEKDFKAVVIEKMLDDLHVAGQPQQPILSEVANFENLQLIGKLNTDMINIFEDLAEGVPEYELTTAAIAQNEGITNFLLNYNYLLLIKTNPVSINTSEFQFRLFEVLAGTKPSDLSPGKLPTVQLESKKDTSINIALSGNQDFLLKNCLQSFFPNSNFPPKPQISLNDQPIIANKKYYFAQPDSFQIDALRSSDDDTPREFWQYKWRQINADNQPNAVFEKTIFLDKKAEKQWLQPPDTGNYLIGLRVDDGIAISKNEDILQLGIIERPEILLNHYEYRKKAKVTFFDWLWNKENRRYKMNTKFKAYFRNQIFPVSDMSFELAGKQSSQKGRPIEAKSQRINQDTFLFELSGKLKANDFFAYKIEGDFEGVTAKPKHFILRQPEMEFMKLEMGFDAFIGFDILQPQNDSSITARMPIAFKGGIFLYHWNHLNPRTGLYESSGSLSLDIGAMIPVRLENFHYAIGQASLKVKAHYKHPKNPAVNAFSIYAAVHATTINWQNDSMYSLRRLWGVGMGFGFPKWKLEIDIINFHYDFKHNQLIYSWGFRRVLYPKL